MAELSTRQTFPGTTPTHPTVPLVKTPTTPAKAMMMPGARYQTLVQGMGADTQGVDSQLASQTSVAAQAQQALQSVSGVNLDQELTNLLGYQQNYEASAKLLATVDATVQSLLQAV
jgi:flagellar hook-associated protein FlgK